MISICIPHVPFNDQIEQVLKVALEDYRKHTKKEFEIILVLNGLDRYNAAESYYGSPNKVIRFQELLGNPRGWNECLKQANGDIIAFMDSDVWVEDNWDEPLVNALSDPKTGIAMPEIFRKESNGEFKNVNDNCQGCAIVMRKSTLDMLSSDLIDKKVPPCFGFDERFSPAYAEDTDLFLRVKLCGWERKTVQGSKACHLSGATCHELFKDEIEGDQKGVQAVATRSRKAFEKKWAHLGYNANQPNCWGMWQ